MTRTIALEITFDREVPEAIAGDVFREQLHDMLTGRRRVQSSEPWGYGRALVVSVEWKPMPIPGAAPEAGGVDTDKGVTA